MAVLLTVFGDTIVSFIPKNKNNIGNKKNRSLTCSFITYHTQSSERTQDSDGYILLTNSKCINIANMLKELNDDIVIINIDDIQANSSNYLKENYDDPNGIAYILYTSGSTGKPKGVIQSNENVLYYIANYSKNLKITNDDNITLFSKYTFDASVMDIYSALLNGATLCIFDVENINLFVAFEEWVLRNQITVYHSVPTVFRHIIRRVKKCEYLETVRVVVLGDNMK